MTFPAPVFSKGRHFKTKSFICSRKELKHWPAHSPKQATRKHFFYKLLPVLLTQDCFKTRFLWKISREKEIIQKSIKAGLFLALKLVNIHAPKS